MKKVKSKTCKLIIFRLTLKLRDGSKFTTLREGKAMVKINAYSLHFLICLIISVMLSQDCAAQGGVVTMQTSAREVKQQPASWWSILVTEAKKFHASQVSAGEAAASAFDFHREKPVIKENNNKQKSSSAEDSRKEKLSSSLSPSSYEFSDEAADTTDILTEDAGFAVSNSTLVIENKRREKAKKD